MANTRSTFNINKLLSLTTVLCGGSKHKPQAHVAIDIDDVTLEDVSIDTLRFRLKQVSNGIAHGILYNFAPEAMETLEAESERLVRCIRYMEEVQRLHSPAPLLAHQHHQSDATNDSRIPMDLPYWQWNGLGNKWHPESIMYETIEDVLEIFEMQVNAASLNLDIHWQRLMPLRMNRDQRS
ncbi:hypothetical protein BDF20DRAFT_998478 [Mycotypha africana]|uniref:uncharacterized protein n=1 Tax=Mycotypha africana TaxID=64632 RepID=UPI0023008F8E|nr:uncharacterized protein BDF20DRAFT_998478 [Mycotypha africana]KAI8987935.1 hypothetical protein BDF20DRAFT_998478 [Mycotypha africana]